MVSKASSISGRLVMIWTGWRFSIVVVEVRGIRREDHRAARGLDAHDLKAGGVAAHLVDADAGQHLVGAVDDLDAVLVVERHEVRERRDIGGPAEGRGTGVAARPERHLVLLDPELGLREQGVAGPVIVVEMRDEAERHVARLDADALDDFPGLT